MSNAEYICLLVLGMGLFAMLGPVVVVLMAKYIKWLLDKVGMGI